MKSNQQQGLKQHWHSLSCVFSPRECFTPILNKEKNLCLEKGLMDLRWSILYKGVKILVCYSRLERMAHPIMHSYAACYLAGQMMESGDGSINSQNHHLSCALAHGLLLLWCLQCTISSVTNQLLLLLLLLAPQLLFPLLREWWSLPGHCWLTLAPRSAPSSLSHAASGGIWHSNVTLEDHSWAD